MFTNFFLIISNNYHPFMNFIEIISRKRQFFFFRYYLLLHYCNRWILPSLTRCWHYVAILACVSDLQLTLNAMSKINKNMVQYWIYSVNFNGSDTMLNSNLEQILTHIFTTIGFNACYEFDQLCCKSSNNCKCSME